MSRSFTSASNGALNTSADNIGKFTVKMTLNHHEYKYNISKSINYVKKMPFKIDYRYCEQF